MHLVQVSPAQVPVSLAKIPVESDDFLRAALSKDCNTLVFTLGDAEADQYFIGDLSTAGGSERELAVTLVRHLRHYRSTLKLQGELFDELRRANDKIAVLEEQNHLLKRKIYGSSSEKSSSTESPKDSESGAADEGMTEQKHACHERVQRPCGRKPLSSSLPRENVEHNIPVEDRFCPTCKNALRHIGADITEQITVVPAKYRVLRHIRHKFACPCCETVVSAAMPKTMFPGGSYNSPEFLAHIAVLRFQYGLPYYRIEKILQSEGINVSRTTLAAAMIRCTGPLSPLRALLHGELLSQPVIHADETTFQVLKEEGRSPKAKSYMWVFRSGRDAEHQAVVFEYKETRSGKHPRRFLKPEGATPYRGYLQVDGYSGYNGISDEKRVGCMAHVRRKFDEVLQIIPQQKRQNAEATFAINTIGRLYAIEAKLADQPPRRRFEIRQMEAKPILETFHEWLLQNQQTALPKGRLGLAIGYALDQWPYILRYIEDGCLEIDNNIVEREIKAFVIGRKNWLFADTPAGAEADAMFYSLTRSVIANGMDPNGYFIEVFTRLPDMTTAKEVEMLAPWIIKNAQGQLRAAA